HRIPLVAEEPDRCRPRPGVAGHTPPNEEKVLEQWSHRYRNFEAIAAPTVKARSTMPASGPVLYTPGHLVRILVAFWWTPRSMQQPCLPLGGTGSRHEPGVR